MGGREDRSREGREGEGMEVEHGLPSSLLFIVQLHSLGFTAMFLPLLLISFL